MTYIIKDLGEDTKKLYEDMNNKILDQDAKLIVDLCDICVFVPLRCIKEEIQNWGLILYLISTHLSGSHKALDILGPYLAFIF